MPDLDIGSVDWEKGDGLVPAVIQNVSNGHVLMLGYMNKAALNHTITSGKSYVFQQVKKSALDKGGDLW